jgi:hypothetical protein
MSDGQRRHPDKSKIFERHTYRQDGYLVDPLQQIA